MQLEAQGYNQQNDQSNDRLEVPGARYARNQVVVSLGFPNASYNSSRSTRVAGDQIAWSHGAGKVGAFRKVSSLILGGKDGSVSSWSAGAPGGVFLFTGKQGQCPTGVNPCNCTPGNVEGSENISESYPALINLHPGKPKEQNHKVTNESHARQHAEATLGAFGSENHTEYQGQQQHDANGQNAAEFRSKNLHDSNHLVSKGVFA